MTTRIPFSRRPRTRVCASGGFTLVELLVAMVIAGILLAIAIPGYNGYVRQGRRTDAKSALLDMASMEERYFSMQNIYSQLTTDLGYTGAWPVTVGSGYYQVSISQFTPATLPTAASPGGTPATYTLQAVPVPTGDQAKDTACTSFTLTSQGVQSSTPAGGSCW
jgi:type IV pilus assembly protein PilE